jgi:hypothetical protein
MQRPDAHPPGDLETGRHGESTQQRADTTMLSVPPAVVGFLLLLVVVLACTFYIVAQVVQTP